MLRNVVQWTKTRRGGFVGTDTLGRPFQVLRQSDGGYRVFGRLTDVYEPLAWGRTVNAARDSLQRFLDEEQGATEATA